MTYIRNIINQDETILVPTDYPTIQSAIESIRNCIISNGTTVTIRLEAGRHVVAAGEVWEHPYAGHIKISGVTPLSRSVTYASHVYNSPVDSSVTYSVADVSNITTDTLLLITPKMFTAGSGRYFLHAGCWKVLSVGANSFVVRNSSRNHDGSTSAAFDAKILRSVYAIPAVSAGNSIDVKSSFKAIENIGFDGGLTYPTSNGSVCMMVDGLNRGVLAKDAGNLFVKSCGFINYSYGFITYQQIAIKECAASSCAAYGLQFNGVVKLDDAAVNGNGFGVYQHGNYNAQENYIWICGNTSFGIFGDASIKGVINNSIIAYNGSYGISSNQSQMVYANIRLEGNAEYGIACARGSSARFAGTCVITNNNGSAADVLALHQSHISRGSATVTGTYTLSPNANRNGNNNSYIRW